MVARQKPAPIGGEGQQNASRNAESTSQMRRGIVDGITMSMAALCAANRSRSLNGSTDHLSMRMGAETEAAGCCNNRNPHIAG